MANLVALSASLLTPQYAVMQFHLTNSLMIVGVLALKKAWHLYPNILFNKACCTPEFQRYAITNTNGLQNLHKNPMLMQILQAINIDYCIFLNLRVQHALFQR